jgi:hypothetical protein
MSKFSMTICCKTYEELQLYMNAIKDLRKLINKPLEKVKEMDKNDYKQIVIKDLEQFKIDREFNYDAEQDELLETLDKLKTNC